jgi:hypothetical protein
MSDVALRVSLCALACFTAVALPPELGCVIFLGAVFFSYLSFFLSKVAPISRTTYIPFYDVPRSWRPITPFYYPNSYPIHHRPIYPISFPRMDVVGERNFCAAARYCPRVDVVGSR